MKLEDQVISLELAKRLHELGVNQDSYFCWNTTGFGEFQSWDIVQNRWRGVRSSLGIYAAFTVAELGELLPGCVESHHSDMRLPENRWACSKVRQGDSQWNVFIQVQFAKTEADVRAEMLIHLLGKNLIPTGGKP